MNHNRIVHTLKRWADRLDESLWRLDGYVVIPHELIHVLAYRIIRKPCQYRPGDHVVRPLSERTLGEEVFIKLFPLAVVGSLAAVTFGMWVMTLPPGRFDPASYLASSPRWHIGLMLLTILLQVYAAASFWDVRAVIELLVKDPRKNR